MRKAKDDQIARFVEVFGVDDKMLREMMELHLTDENINEFGKYDKLKATADINKAKIYFEKITGETLSVFKVRSRLDILLRKFILSGGFEL
jgi:type I restriction enzyme R subunit